MWSLLWFVILIPVVAHADTRFGVHAGGGLEAGMVRSAHPEGVAEVGAIGEHLWTGRRWGIAGAFERIGRGYDDVVDEWKVDGGICFASQSRRFHAIVGVGYRTMTVPGAENRLPSKIHGVDLIRLDDQITIVRRGRIALDFYFNWTLGVYRGRQYDERIGDMAQTTSQVGALTTAYTLGLQTSFVLD